MPEPFLKPLQSGLWDPAGKHSLPFAGRARSHKLPASTKRRGWVPPSRTVWAQGCANRAPRDGFTACSGWRYPTPARLSGGWGLSGESSAGMSGYGLWP